MNQEENELLEILADAWNRFSGLEALHEWDREEFAHGIHALQNIVMSRQVMKDVRD